VEYDKRFRIGHMGHNNVPMVMGVMGAIDAALKALNIPHGDGALEAASRVIATSQVNRKTDSVIGGGKASRPGC
jgi:alanine-glyoxylate transaminase/serine-glyoxylate transaminase/serine-pyruvate transaminase